MRHYLGETMMRTLIFAAVFALSGCQAVAFGTASDLNKVSVGMSRAQVIEAIGTPTTTSASANSETLSYKRMPSTLGWMPKLYDVTLADGKVVSYGEHRK
jgi:hypothetical protein